MHGGLPWTYYYTKKGPKPISHIITNRVNKIHIHDNHYNHTIGNIIYNVAIKPFSIGRYKGELLSRGFSRRLVI